MGVAGIVEHRPPVSRDAVEEFRFPLSRLEDTLYAPEMPDGQRDIPPYESEFADVMTKEDFIQQVSENGMFTEYDGTGYPAKDGLMDRNQFVFPLSRIPEDATHVVWFNK